MKFFTKALWRSCNTAKRFATWVLTVIVLFTILKTCCYNLMIMTAAVMIDMFIYKWNTSLLQEQKFWFLFTSCVQDMSMHFYYIIQLVNIRGCTKYYTHMYIVTVLVIFISFRLLLACFFKNQLLVYPTDVGIVEAPIVI